MIYLKHKNMHIPLFVLKYMKFNFISPHNFYTTQTRTNKMDNIWNETKNKMRCVKQFLREGSSVVVTEADPRWFLGGVDLIKSP